MAVGGIDGHPIHAEVLNRSPPGRCGSPFCHLLL